MLDFSEGEFVNASVQRHILCIERKVRSFRSMWLSVSHALPSLETFSFGCWLYENTNSTLWCLCWAGASIPWYFYTIFTYSMDFLRQVVVLVVCYFSGFVTLQFLGATEMEHEFKLALDVHVHISFNYFFFIVSFLWRENEWDFRWWLYKSLWTNFR